MIIMWMAGGLGNQLFILNKALELKEKNRFLFLDTYFYDNDVRYKRKFHFKEKLKIIPVFNKKLRYILFRLNKVLNKINMFYFRDESNFEKIKNKFFQVIYLTGYWQEKIIPNKRNIDLINEVFKEIKIKDESFVAVHFRSEEYDIKLPSSYYLNALKLFDDSKYEFHLFGDSKEYLREMKKEIFKNKKCKIIDLKDEILDFEELKSYRNYISSNSTFCWWALILNQDNISKVTSPKKWNVGYEEEYNIYIPAEWELV